ncbi:MAG: CDP-diacylglycerol--glycerol-3-phosphate 3-phosphatidyltransferase [Thelocarpon superellum]|nr:MAG: CDP-diacylglycerol--glycerol-3-phosphate 3-phosphatidyltransferase [Thelocarpon superellum]
MPSPLGFLYSQTFVTLPYPEQDFTDQSVIVTGSNVGLGLEAARHFTRLNASKVILAVRSLAKGEEAKSSIEASTRREGVLEVWQLDLGSYESVRQFVQRAQGLPRLDVVVENAGVASFGFAMVEDNERMITVNVISTFLLALMILPKLRETARKFKVEPHLVIVTSEVHVRAKFAERTSEGFLQVLGDKDKANMAERYPLSKLLEVFYVRELAARTKTSGKGNVIINCVNPGLCHSSLSREAPFMLEVMKFFLARSTEHGSRSLVPAPLVLRALTPLGGIISELDRIAPRFDLDASQIEVLQSPSEFYETLKFKLQHARKRIYLSTLYIGKTEHELISTIRHALASQPGLRVSFLVDALRGTRESPEPSCASLLAPLIREFGADRVEVRLYHTPNLTGLRKRIVPRRINEGWGLQHMKLYGVDDEIIISGANLSTDYFTNRQDRYHVFSSGKMTDYFARIHDVVGSLSFRVQPDPDPLGSGYTVEWPPSNSAPSPLVSPGTFIESSSKVLRPLIQPTGVSRTDAAATHDTIVYPLAQLTPLLRPDSSTEHRGLTAVLRNLSSSAFADSRWMFTAGYFNIHPTLKSLLLSSTSTHGTVITASPWANGFYGSRGVSGMLPAAYTLLSRRFLESVQRAGRGSQIELKEWRRGTVGTPGGWTYHAKGLWVTLPREQWPSITLVGSSNYTKRSYSLDLEMNALVVTTNGELKEKLGQEQQWLQEYARPVGLDDFTRVERRVGLHVRIAMWIVRLVGGAL